MEHIPFLSLQPQHDRIRSEIANTFNKVLATSRFILGPEVEQFEKEFAAYSETSFCIGVGNGLDALTLSLRSLHLAPGDEVIVPAHTFMATWLAVIRAGAKPIAVDADPNTFNIDVSRITEKISGSTKAIVPVHMYGQACNMTEILDIAQRYNIAVVEDNAQAQGARWLQKLTGSFGLINATSFYPTKNLGALGDGGAVTLYDPDTADFVRRHRNYGLLSHYAAADLGINSRLDEVQAAILRIKLRYLDEWNMERRRIAGRYLFKLQGVGDLLLPLSDKEAEHVYHLFVVRTARRNALHQFLTQVGIQTLIHYPVPPHLQRAFKDLGNRQGMYPVAEQIAETCLSLPLWPGMTDDQIDRVCFAIQEFY